MYRVLDCNSTLKMMYFVVFIVLNFFLVTMADKPEIWIVRVLLVFSISYSMLPNPTILNVL